MFLICELSETNSYKHSIILNKRTSSGQAAAPSADASAGGQDGDSSLQVAMLDVNVFFHIF